MTLSEKLTETRHMFSDAYSVSTIWSRIPSIIDGVVDEFRIRLRLDVDIVSVRLVLAQYEPGRTYGNNYVVFKANDSKNLGLVFRCECCFEHPNANVSIDQMPNAENAAEWQIASIESKFKNGLNETNLLELPAIGDG